MSFAAQFTHQLVLSTLKGGRLKYLDRLVRRAVWEWLKFKIKLPKPLLYAPCSAGGLGIQNFQHLIPATRFNRACRLQVVYGDPLVESIFPLNEVITTPIVCGEPVDSLGAAD